MNWPILDGFSWDEKFLDRIKILSRLTGRLIEDPPVCQELFIDSLTGSFDPNRLDPANRIGLFCLNLAGLNLYLPSLNDSNFGLVRVFVFWLYNVFIEKTNERRIFGSIQ
jgi:hypothetical protein